jgi:hypothetical protein
VSAARTAATPSGVAAPAPEFDDHGRPLTDCPDCGGLAFDPRTPGFECVCCAGLGLVLAPELEPEEL